MTMKMTKMPKYKFTLPDIEVEADSMEDAFERAWEKVMQLSLNDVEEIE